MRRNGIGRLGKTLAPSALALVLALSLGAPLAAAPRAAAPARTEATVAQTWLGTLWGWLRAVWEEEGSMIDPLGGQHATPGTGGAEEGAGIDPLGAAQVPPGEAPHGEQGGMIDPLG